MYEENETFQRILATAKLKRENLKSASPTFSKNPYFNLVFPLTNQAQIIILLRQVAPVTNFINSQQRSSHMINLLRIWAKQKKIDITHATYVEVRKYIQFKVYKQRPYNLNGKRVLYIIKNNRVYDIYALDRKYSIGETVKAFGGIHGRGLQSLKTDYTYGLNIFGEKQDAVDIANLDASRLRNINGCEERGEFLKKKDLQRIYANEKKIETNFRTNINVKQETETNWAY